MTEEENKYLVNVLEALAKQKIQTALDWAQKFENGPGDKNAAQIAALVHLHEMLVPFSAPIGETLCKLAYTDVSIVTWLTEKFTFEKSDIYDLFRLWMSGGAWCEAFSVFSMNKKYEIMQAAASHGDREMIEWMLTKSIDVDFRDDEKQTALHLAAEHGHKDLVKFLLRKGASPFAVDSGANTPFDKAFDSLQFDTADLLHPLMFVNRKQHNGWMLPLAASRGNHKQVEYLMKYQITTESVNGALFIAAIEGYPAVVETILLTMSPSLIDVTNGLGDTALSLAVKNNYPKVVEKLLAAGAFLDQKIVYIAKERDLKDVLEVIEVMDNLFHSLEERKIL